MAGIQQETIELFRQQFSGDILPVFMHDGIRNYSCEMTDDGIAYVKLGYITNDLISDKIDRYKRMRAAELELALGTAYTSGAGPTLSIKYYRGEMELEAFDRPITDTDAMFLIALRYATPEHPVDVILEDLRAFAQLSVGAAFSS